MTRFIRFSKLIVNTNFIETIQINSDSYIINTSGFVSDWFVIFGSGGSHTSNQYIKICKKESPTDYNIMTNYINTNFPIVKETKTETEMRDSLNVYNQPEQYFTHSNLNHNITYNKNNNWKPEI